MFNNLSRLIYWVAQSNSRSSTPTLVHKYMSTIIPTWAWLVLRTMASQGTSWSSVKWMMSPTLIASLFTSELPLFFTTLTILLFALSSSLCLQQSCPSIYLRDIHQIQFSNWLDYRPEVILVSLLDHGDHHYEEEGEQPTLWTDRGVNHPGEYEGDLCRVLAI